MSRLLGKKVLVTAAGRGIGRAVALSCAAEGASVLATDREFDALSHLEHPEISTMQIDGTVLRDVEVGLENYLPFHSVIHCVGYVPHGSVLDCDPEEWRRSFEVNVDSFYNTTKACLPGMVDNGGGSITCISSVASTIKAVPHRAAYSAAKAAMIGLVKSVAIDFSAQGVRCNAVCPGTIESPSLLERIADLGRTMGNADRARQMFIDRQPMGRLGTPEEVAALCVYLASDESSFVTGQFISIDGGMSL